MAKVGIVTDTIACLPPEIIKELDISILPVALNINGKPCRDGIDINPDGFWKMFPKLKEFTTAAPALSEYSDILTNLSKTTDNIVCIFVSKALSAIYEVAIQASDLFKKENPMGGSLWAMMRPFWSRSARYLTESHSSASEMRSS